RMTASSRSRIALSGPETGSDMGPLLPHGDSRRAHMRLGLADRELAEMEDGGRQHRGGMALAHPADEMVEIADAARGADRHADRVRYRARQRIVEALACPVAVHRGQQDLARAELDRAPRPVDRVQPRRLPAAMREDLPPAGRHLLGIDADDDALAAELLR